MNRFSMPSKSILSSVVRSLLPLIAFTAILGGCYEGSSKSGGSGGLSGKPGRGGLTTKPYGVAILDVIRPSDSALVSASCGQVPQSLADLRKKEMEARFEGVYTLLDAQADSLTLRVTVVQDCDTFSEVVRRATHPGSLPASSTYKDKPAINVRLVLWYGDSSYRRVDDAVSQSEWADMRQLDDADFDRRLSVNYFAISSQNPFRGYVAAWQGASDSSLNYSAETINHLVPTEAGLKSLMLAVQNSTTGFSDWLSAKTGAIQHQFVNPRRSTDSSLGSAESGSRQ